MESGFYFSDNILFLFGERHRFGGAFVDSGVFCDRSDSFLAGKEKDSQNFERALHIYIFDPACRDRAIHCSAGGLDRTQHADNGVVKNRHADLRTSKTG